MRSNNVVLNGFIALEGLDGAGTTTQSDLLYRRIAAEGRRVVRTSEPTDGPIGLLVREILAGRVTAEPSTVAYLFAADRNEHLRASGEGILALVGDGTLVVSDRYLFSSLAYQTVDTPWDVVAELNRRFPLPEVTIYLDLPVETALGRIEKRHHHEIYEHLQFQQQVHENYARALSEWGASVVRVDGAKPQSDIHEEIWSRPEIQSILEE